MVYTYEHDNVTTEASQAFECDLVCRRCEARASSGRRCGRRVCIWLPYCWQHTRIHFGVKPGPSTHVPNVQGILATKALKKNDMIIPYGGEVLRDNDVSDRYGVGEYALAPYLVHQLDAACVRHVGSGVNGAFGVVPPSAINVRWQATSHRYVQEPKAAGTTFGSGKGAFTLTRDNQGIKYWIVASRDIGADEELILDYGAGYADAFARRDQRCSERSLKCDVTKRKRSKKT